MADLPEVASPASLAARRRQKRWERRRQRLQRFWRFVGVTAIAAGLVWVLARPLWIIQDPRRIQIQGQQTLNRDRLLATLNLQMPLNLLQLQPQRLEQQLLKAAPLQAVQIQRRLLPASLIITVQEITATAQASRVVVEPNQPPQERWGILDRQGVWHPLSAYERLGATLPTTTLKVRGYREPYQRLWPGLYSLLRTSPVGIQGLDWRDPANIILETELGPVYCGPYNPELLPQQIAMLDRLRQLPDKTSRSAIAYIDLRQPSTPRVQMKPSAPPRSLQTNPR
ncbi:cell division protein FtsQ/DivIB [Synechococcus elongatus]|uniref:Cell division protein FtsQ n=2 Tax=Synechococcus elongatus TaxID=32046 RepID=Q31KL2_SYNE7|nr:FtsQ-type POTRA domain-containing protein [Synechococcus elongatus]ABB58407.1 cell division protein FtsQ [Synechococcus elongatus PCC 7942 = FACHB-805]AJD57130.1 cell division protein FtsQ [Synechococcus elongatus UTEX 2973]MBD2587129.1 FtsQ-type POTRA domain-containing protein [Synechococcus elongatus FACHB-242]MBD2688200.1 FtsQ-type POTRA domain-containing protein [Synechococcus elongatus FACHB-1061]MBD2706089.1 FtsQ-type POTRA domain-containing protein [Synechococcus elongatus PCC 7942 =